MRRVLVMLVIALLVIVPTSDGVVRFGSFVALTAQQKVAALDGLEEFEEVEAEEDGLGPAFNGRSCAECHSNPVVGGDSNILEERFGAVDAAGYFDPLAHLGGSLRQLSGIDPTNGCGGEIIPAEANVVAQRKTTPLFGLGLVDEIPDAAIIAYAEFQARVLPGIAGWPHMVVDATTGEIRVGRFGWKAQQASLLTFSADAYINEMGITNPVFPNENAPNGDLDRLAQCQRFAGDGLEDEDGAGVAAFFDFMRALAPPPRGKVSVAAKAGEVTFAVVGCAGCHRPQWRTGVSDLRALSNKTLNPYSDFLLHDMGALGDGITQGEATGRLMRTAPLWGLRVRTAFLHDARCAMESGQSLSGALECAILAHDGQAEGARRLYQALPKAAKNLVLTFLGSL